MKKQIQVLAILLFVVGVAFAHDKKISCNGVAVPDWMLNCVVLKSEMGFGSAKCIGDLFGTPNKGTKIKKVIVDGNKLHLEYYVGEKASESALDAIFDFVCAKIGDAGTAYASYVKFSSRLTFEEIESYCKNPNSDPGGFGKTLGIMTRSVQTLFFDEERVAKEKADAEEQRKMEAEQETRRKNAAYLRELEQEIASGEIELGFSVDRFSVKYNPLSESVSLTVKSVDEVMSRAGFQKGDLITNIYYVEKSHRDELFIEFQLAVRDESYRSRFALTLLNDVMAGLKEDGSFELPENITLIIKRKGKVINCMLPAFNQNQIKSLKSRFELE